MNMTLSDSRRLFIVSLHFEMFSSPRGHVCRRNNHLFPFYGCLRERMRLFTSRGSTQLPSTPGSPFYAFWSSTVSRPLAQWLSALTGPFHRSPASHTTHSGPFLQVEWKVRLDNNMSVHFWTKKATRNVPLTPATGLCGFDNRKIQFSLLAWSESGGKCREWCVILSGDTEWVVFHTPDDLPCSIFVSLFYCFPFSKLIFLDPCRKK